MTRIAVLVVMGLASPVHADAPACQDLVGRARAHHEAERFREALAASEAAYACEPQPSLLYAMGQIAFNLADYRAAARFYEQFLATAPPPEDAAVALQALAVTRERIEAASKPAKIVVVKPRADKLAWGLAIGGGVSAVAGGILYLTAKQRAVDTSGRYADYDDRIDTARTLRIAAIACGGAGAALGIAAVVRWVEPESSRARTSRIVPVITGDSLGLGLVGTL
ncbi:MAG TPA: tetratricopeptide repeat protein [Kofleriaceae bacterium]